MLIVFGVISQSGFVILIAFIILLWQLKKGDDNFNLQNYLNKIFNLSDYLHPKPKLRESQSDNGENSNLKHMEIINPNKKKRISLWIILGLAFILIFSFASRFWVVIGAGETGVQTFFGKVRDEEFASGFHLKNPLVKVTKMNVRTQEYTMSVAQGEGKKATADAITALTKEGLSVDLDITVLYHLVQEKASDVYRDIGLTYDEIVIRPQIRSVIREVIAQYEAKDIYSEKRQEAAQKIFADLQVQLLPRGIEVEDALLRHVQLPADLAQSIQLKLQSEQESQRYDFVLQTEKKEAERKIIEAQGQRDAQQIINQSLSDKYLQYLYINSLKDRQGTIYVPTNPNNGVPMFKGI